MYEIEFSNGSFLEIDGNKKNLTEINKNFLIKKLTKYGAIIFKNFNVNSDLFSQFIEKNSTKSSIDPARNFFNKNLQIVDAGTDPIGMHCENGNAPKLPNLVWFFCENGSQKGSQTTLCDGFKVWQELDDVTKKICLFRKIKYVRSIKEDLWRKYIIHEFPNYKYDYIDEKKLKKIFENIEGLTVNLNSDHSLNLEFISPFAHKTLFSHKIAFANSLFGPSYNYQKPIITFENGEEIPASLLTYMESICENLTYEINWNTHDFVLIDNTRTMHGRRKILDPNRKILISLSDIF